MTSRAFAVVESFEAAMAEFAGARYGVAMESCSAALFFSCLYEGIEDQAILIPARTYISVPAAIIHAGGRVVFSEGEWSGAYRLGPTGIVDSALRMRRGMFQEQTSPPDSAIYYCLSFHARKHLRIGRGGMVLTDDKEAANWLRKARFDGRDGSVPFMQDRVTFLGWNAYMTPEQAARGLQLLEALPDDLPDLTPDYPDLRQMPVFK